jgi:hypothetical protein
MAIIDEINEVLHKIEAKLYPNYLGKGTTPFYKKPLLYQTSPHTFFHSLLLL